jgi:hypothetical protein
MAEKKPSVSVHNPEAHQSTPEIERLTLSFPAADKTKMEAIKHCVEHGELKITLSKVHLASGRVGEAWEYD